MIRKRATAISTELASGDRSARIEACLEPESSQAKKRAAGTAPRPSVPAMRATARPFQPTPPVMPFTALPACPRTRKEPASPAMAPLTTMAHAPEPGREAHRPCEGRILPEEPDLHALARAFRKENSAAQLGPRRGERRGSRAREERAGAGGRLNLSAVMPRRLEPSSLRGPPIAQSTTMRAACARRKLVSMTCAPVLRSARAERRARQAPAAAAASIADRDAEAGGLVLDVAQDPCR